MGLLGLRKFIDSSGCTRLLPVPVSDADAEEEALRRLRIEGYHEVTDISGAKEVYYESSSPNNAHPEAVNGDRQRSLTSSTHVHGAAAQETGGSATPVADHVLVDMNCIVHSCFHHQIAENKSKRQLIQEILERLRVLLTEVVIPRQSLSICFDGPAPIAKLQTQRLRRRKVSLMDTGGIQQLNTLSITAGSLFMIELENAIAAQFKLNHGRGFLRRACPVYLYGTTVMGEGEAKISRALAFLAYGPRTESSEGESATGAGAETGVEVSRNGARNGRQGHHSSRNSNGGGRGEGRSNGWRGRGGNSSRSRSGDDRLNVNGRREDSEYGEAGKEEEYGVEEHAVGAYGGHALPVSPIAAQRAKAAHYNPDDTVVVLGNDIDLVVTCLGATAYHNFSIISPSSLQLIRVSDILYRWLKATSALSGSSPFTPAQLPSIRIDFIYLFLLNGGDHYTGAGEVAMPLWSRYRSVRAAYPHSSLVSPTLDSIDVDFLADVVQAAEYTGSSTVSVGMNLLQSALWSLYTVVTGVCPNYNYVPQPEGPQLSHLRAAAAHCQRTHRPVRLPHFSAASRPLTPLETFVALMPTEAALPKSVVAGLHSKPAHHAILKTLETSNDTAMIARAARDAVAVSEPFLTTSEQYLRHFTSPVQLNVVPPRRRLSRHEQHRMMATTGHVVQEDPVPVVKPIAMAEDVAYLSVPYAANTRFLNFACPFEEKSAEEDAAVAVGEPSAAVTTVQGRVVSSRPTMHAALAATAAAANPASATATAAAAAASTIPQSQKRARSSSAPAVDDKEVKRVYLYEEEAAQEAAARDRQTAATKLKRTLSGATLVKRRNQHLTKAQVRQMRSKMQRLMEAEEAERKQQMEREEKKYTAATHHDTAEIEEEVLRFLGEGATAEDVTKVMMNPSKPKLTKAKKAKLAKKQRLAEMKKRREELTPTAEAKYKTIGPRPPKQRLTKRQKAALEREERAKAKLEKKAQRRALLKEKRMAEAAAAAVKAKKALKKGARKVQEAVVPTKKKASRGASSTSASSFHTSDEAPAKKKPKKERRERS